VPLFDETAEESWGPIRTPVSRQPICLDHSIEVLRTAAFASRFYGDLMAAGEIDFSAVSDGGGTALAVSFGRGRRSGQPRLGSSGSLSGNSIP
jgi:hypothetical protein